MNANEALYAICRAIEKWVAEGKPIGAHLTEEQKKLVEELRRQKKRQPFGKALRRKRRQINRQLKKIRKA